MKHVYGNDMVAHIWANQSQDYARNGKDTVSFRGPEYYSYNTMVARITNATYQGKIVVLINDNLWGVTTGRHIYRAERALDTERYHVMRVFRVCGGYRYDPNAEGGRAAIPHTSNVAKLFEAYTKRQESLCKPHVSWYGRDDSLDHRLRAIYDSATDYRSYCMAFGVDEPHPNFEYWTYKCTQAFKRYYGHGKAQYMRVVAEYAAYAEGLYNKRPYMPTHMPSGLRKKCQGFVHEREYKPEPDYAITPEQWMDGAGHTSPYYRTYRDSTWPDYPLLRRKGGTLQTSMGATVPWQDAMRIFAIAHSARCRGMAIYCESLPLGNRVGSFTVDRIGPDGSIKAGCHLIPYAESLRLAIREAPELVRPCHPLPMVV